MDDIERAAINSKYLKCRPEKESNKIRLSLLLFKYLLAWQEKENESIDKGRERTRRPIYNMF